MNFTRIRWAAAALSLAVSGLMGCSEVDHCKEGAKGCQAGPCLADNKCSFDLVCAQKVPGGGAVCGEKKQDGSFDCGKAGKCEPMSPPDNDDGGVPPVGPCTCTGENELCAPGTDDVCINFCAPTPENYINLDTRKKEFLPCRTLKDVPVSYEDACRALVKQICFKQPYFCGGLVCEPGFHNTPAAQTLCMDKVGADLEALYTACETVRDADCDNFNECPAESPRDCSDKDSIVCSNTCPYPADGACDDGDGATAAYAECAWGTDCGDCGPRRGSAPPAKVGLGELCVEDKHCKGFSQDLRINEAWCLEVDSQQEGVYRCMPDCTRNDECPEGYSCVGISVDGAPITQGDLSARVCNPVICL